MAWIKGGGGASLAPLKEALQYADGALGIDVETSSYSEICDALADVFPEECILFDNGNTHDELTGGWYQYVDGTGAQLINSYLFAQTGTSSGNSILMTQNKIKIPQNALNLKFTVYHNRAEGSYHYTYIGASRSHNLDASIMLVGQTFSNVDVYNNVYSYDVTALRGDEVYIGIKSYMGGTQSGKYADLTVSKIEIELDT